jgi:hypothetical protein
MAEADVLLCGDIELENYANLIAKFGLTLEVVPDGESIQGSWFGDPEAGIIAKRVLVRADTPVHSAFHETCHLICMDKSRREHLHTNAGGDYDEENAVNYLQITLSDYLPQMGRDRMFYDMDNWGYTFRLGSSKAWFEQDAEDARQWLINHSLINEQGEPLWNLRQ